MRAAISSDSIYPHATWRLIYDSPAPGAWNMAVDEAILEAVEKGTSPPTLRLFAWDPACVSLGYAQPVADLDLSRLASLGWQAVRRPTGGRALLHCDEITYSVSGLKSDPRLAGSLLSSYRRISACLLAALDLLNIHARAEANPEVFTKTPPQNPICFEAPSNYEITFSGKKLIGSAQVRRKLGLLQHGSLPLTGDITRLTQVLAFPTEIDRQQAAERLAARALTAETILGKTIGWESAAEAFSTAFQKIFNLTFTMQGLSVAEIQRASQLAVDKYGLLDWRQKKSGDLSP